LHLALIELSPNKRTQYSLSVMRLRSRGVSLGAKPSESMMESDLTSVVGRSESSRPGRARGVRDGRLIVREVHVDSPSEMNGVGVTRPVPHTVSALSCKEEAQP